MNSVEIKQFALADEVNESFDHAKIEAVNVRGQRVLRLTLEPGWKWSQDVKPNIGTDSCQADHLGVIIAGSIACLHDDGTEKTYSAGDAYSIAPGHDAWVVGDETAVAFEFGGLWGE